MFRQHTRGGDLRQYELFGDCTDQELASVDSLLTRLRLDTGRVLLREGAHDQQFMIIVEGSVGVTRGEGSAIAILSTGSFVGEMSMLTGDPRSATVIALSPVEILVCNSKEFAALLDTAPSVKDKLTAEAAGRMVANAQAA